MIKILGNMQCCRCLQKGHPASNYTKKITNTNSDKKTDDKNKSLVNQLK